MVVSRNKNSCHDSVDLFGLTTQKALNISRNSLTKFSKLYLIQPK